MWIIKAKHDITFEPIEVVSEREAYDYCKEFGTDKFYYEFENINRYMERKTKQWKKQKSTQ